MLIVPSVLQNRTLAGARPPQMPFVHVSVSVQAFASLQGVPLGLAGLEHTPVPGLHTPASWHWSEAVQTTGVWAQPVPTHESTVQGSPSSQALTWIQP